MKRTFLKTLSDWLQDELTPHPNWRYWHRRLSEQLAHRTEIVEELKVLIQEAHEDVRNRLRRIHGLENTLDPLEEQLTPRTGDFTIDEYPRELPIDTLKGYFGEVFTAVIAENFKPLGEDWIVPAFLFRFHNLAFHYLEEKRQGVTVSENLVGRHGDDCLAFQRDSLGKIVRVLACEAKCTPDHQLGMVTEAHVKASRETLVPTSVSEVIAVLQDYANTDQAIAGWVDALRQLRAVTTGTSGYERCDLINYICGLPPVRETTEVIPVAAPHAKYTGGRRLEGVEIHLYDVEGLVEQVYGKVFSLPNSGNIASEANWRKIVSMISPQNHQTIFEQQCWLEYFDGQRGVVGVRTLALFRKIQRRENNLQEAFIKAGLFVPTTPKDKPIIKFQHFFPDFS